MIIRHGVTIMSKDNDSKEKKQFDQVMDELVPPQNAKMTRQYAGPTGKPVNFKLEGEEELEKENSPMSRQNARPLDLEKKRPTLQRQDGVAKDIGKIDGRPGMGERQQGSRNLTDRPKMPGRDDWSNKGTMNLMEYVAAPSAPSTTRTNATTSKGKGGR